MGRIFEGEKRVREMVQGLGDAVRRGERDEDVEATIVLRGGREVEGVGSVSSPRFPVFRRIVGDDELAGRVYGMGGEIEGKRVQTVPCG